MEDEVKSYKQSGGITAKEVNIEATNLCLAPKKIYPKKDKTSINLRS